MAMNPVVETRGADRLAIATDARRGEVYFQVFHPRSLESLSPPALLTVEAAAAVLAGTSSVIAGSGAAAVCAAARDNGDKARAICPELLPEAIDMLFLSSEWPSVARVAPLYLRPRQTSSHPHRAHMPLLRTVRMTSNVTPFRNIKHVSMLWAAPERSAEIAALHKRLFYPAWDEAAVNGLLNIRHQRRSLPLPVIPKLSSGSSLVSSRP